jgi:hypothetical protein
MPSPLALAMMQQQPVAAPPQASVNPTDVAQIYKNAQDAAVQAWKAQLDQRNAMWGTWRRSGAAGSLRSEGQWRASCFRRPAPAPLTIEPAGGNGTHIECVTLTAAHAAHRVGTPSVT